MLAYFLQLTCYFAYLIKLKCLKLYSDFNLLLLWMPNAKNNIFYYHIPLTINYSNFLIESYGLLSQ